MSIQRRYNHTRILTLKIIKIKTIFIIFGQHSIFNLKAIPKKWWVQLFCLFPTCRHLCLTRSLDLSIRWFLKFPVASISCYNDGMMTHILTTPLLPLFTVNTSYKLQHIRMGKGEVVRTVWQASGCFQYCKLLWDRVSGLWLPFQFEDFSWGEGSLNDTKYKTVVERGNIRVRDKLQG